MSHTNKTTIKNMSQNVTKRAYKRYKQCHKMSQEGIKRLINSIFVHKDKYLNATDRKRLEWQSRVLYFYFTIFYLSGVGIAIISDWEPCGKFYNYANIVQGSLIVFILLLHFKKIIAIKRAIAFTFSICTLEIIIEMFHQAMYDGSRGPFSIMTNMVILISIASISALAYVKKLSLCISAVAFITYIICAYIAGSREMADYSYLLALAFICVTFVGTHLVRMTAMLTTENQVYKEEQEQFLNYMELSKEQWSELLEALRVTGKKIDLNKTKEILELMEDRLQARLAYKAKEMLKEEQDYTAQILQHCPSLTDLELKIANYIIKGMSTPEIASAMDTTISAVTTVRSRIRGKCELERKASLQCYLRKLVGKEEECIN